MAASGRDEPYQLGPGDILMVESGDTPICKVKSELCQMDPLYIL